MQMYSSKDAAALGLKTLGLGSGKYLVIGVDTHEVPYTVASTTVMDEFPTLAKMKEIGGLYFVIVKSVARPDDRPTRDEAPMVYALNRVMEADEMRVLDFLNIAESGWFSWTDAGLLVPHGGV
jgi:hypothetical protein